MTCPQCNGKVYVIDSVNAPEGDIYRKRKCRECGYLFYTVESEMEAMPSFVKKWSYYHRSNNRRIRQ